MNVYAESGAVLASLLGEVPAADIREVLQRAEIAVASELTLVEVDRVLVRSLALGEGSEAATASRRTQMQEAASTWQVLYVTAGITACVSGREAATAVSGLELLSLDGRVRRSGELLEFRVLP